MCFWFEHEIEYLGLIVGQDSLKPSPIKGNGEGGEDVNCDDVDTGFIINNLQLKNLEVNEEQLEDENVIELI